MQNNDNNHSLADAMLAAIHAWWAVVSATSSLPLGWTCWLYVAQRLPCALIVPTKRLQKRKG